MNQSPSTAHCDAIVAIHCEFTAAFGRGDAAAVAALYTERGQVFPPNAYVITGRQGIETLWQTIMNVGIKRVTLNTVEAESYGDVAHEVGEYALAVEGGEVIEKGEYVIIWRKEEGQWKVHRGMWNSSRPAPR